MIRQFGRPLARRRARWPEVSMDPPGFHGRCRCSSSTDMATLKISGDMTPPTQWRTLSGLLVVVTVCSCRGWGRDAAAGGGGGGGGGGVWGGGGGLLC